MKIRFIAKIYDLSLTGYLGAGVRVAQNMRISNDAEVSGSYMDPIIPIVGLIESQALVEENGLAFAYGEEEIPGTLASLDPLVYLENSLRMLRLYLNQLWYVKDNSVDAEIAFAYTRQGSDIGQVSTNHAAVRFLTAEGIKSPTTFSPSDLRHARDRFFMHLVDDQGQHANDWDLVSEGWLDNRVPDEPTRLDMALLAIQSARSTGYLPSRIGAYCSAFESLLCAGSTEALAHRVAERTAVVLAVGDERVRHFELMKRAYGVRSRHFHGGAPKDSHPKLQRLSTEIDDALRRLMLRIRDDEEILAAVSSKDDQLETYMNHQVLL